MDLTVFLDVVCWRPRAAGAHLEGPWVGHGVNKVMTGSGPLMGKQEGTAPLALYHVRTRRKGHCPVRKSPGRNRPGRALA